MRTIKDDITYSIRLPEKDQVKSYQTVREHTAEFSTSHREVLTLTACNT